MTNTDTDGSALRKQTTFFDMPAEICNDIYHMALVPQYPIELAPVSISLPGLRSVHRGDIHRAKN